MNINFYKIFYIILASITISLIYNHLNPDGLSLIRKEKILTWENDSLSYLTNNDSIHTDTKTSKLNQTKDTIVVDKKSETSEKVKSFKEPRAIKLDFAFKLFNQGIKFIDARSSEEFKDGHIKGAVNIPFYGSENYLDIINRINKDEVIVTYCSSADCDISTLSGEELFKIGFKKVYVFVGGYEEWIQNNYPISMKK